MHTPARYFVCAAFIVAAVFIPTATRTGYTQTAVSADGKLAVDEWNPPIAFEPNHGQADPSVQFVTHGRGYTLSLSADGAVLSLLSAAETPQERLAIQPEVFSELLPKQTEPRPVNWRTTSVRLQLAGADARPSMLAENPLPGFVNYFAGKDPAKWRTRIPTYAQVRYQNVYPGVDLVYYGNSRGELEYDFVVAPGANPSAVRFRIDGANGIELSDAGELVLKVPGGEVRMGRPATYQDLAAGRRRVSGEWTLHGGNEAGFVVGPYDRSAPLVIDPTLIYSAFAPLQGTSWAVAADAAGNAYLAGLVVMAGASTADAFVAKYSPSGALLATTYIAGNRSDEIRAMALDSAGNVYVTGVTDSTNFPTTAGALDQSCGSDGSCNYDGATFFYDGFVAKLTADLSTTVYSTHIGGSNLDYGSGIAVDSSGNAYIAGNTRSANFPTTPGAFDTTLDGTDGFVAKLNATGSSLLFSTLLGGNGTDTLTAIAIDSAGNPYVCGYTNSTVFPLQNAFQPTQLSGTNPAIVAKFNSSGSALVFSTYFSNYTSALSIAVDAAGSAYITGTTSPVPSVLPLKNAFQTSPGPGFVAKFEPSGTALAYSTYWNGNSRAIAVNATGNAHITGTFVSYGGNSLPIRNPIPLLVGRGWAAKFNPAGTDLVYSTPVADADPLSIAVDSSNNAYIGLQGRIQKIYDANTTCDVTLVPVSGGHTSAAASGSFAVNIPSTCGWTAVSQLFWITVTGGSSGTGSGTVTYSVSANTSGAPRTGTININGTLFTVSQSTTDCSYSIGPVSRTHGAGMETSTVSVTATCSWTAVSNVGWISVDSGASGSGSGNVVYTVAANPTTSSRTGTLTIAGQTFTVNQAAGTGPACTFSIDPTTRIHGAAAESGSIALTTQSGCTWSAASNAAWITITAGAGGTGNGTVSYSVAANTGSSPRSGTITVAGQTFTVTQSGLPACTFTIDPTARTHNSSTGTGTVAVTAQSGCTWTATSNSTWIGIMGGASGSGNGTVSYTVASNSLSTSRTGTLTIAGQTFTVTQSAPCTYTVTPASQNFGAAAATGSITVSTQAGCTWTAMSNGSWVTVTAGASGTGSGTVSYSVAANPTGATRSTTIVAASLATTITQEGAACTFTLNPTSRSHTAVAETASVAVNTLSGCNWTASSNASWITIISGSSGGGTGPVVYTVAANTGASSRTGTLTIAGQTFTITQAGVTCSFTVTPLTQAFAAVAGTSSVAVSTQTGCAWSAASNSDWISVISGAAGNGNGTVSYSVASNGGAARTGTLAVAGQTVTITQAAGIAACTFAISPLSRSHLAAGGTGTVSLSTQANCAWTATSNVPWITVATAGGNDSGTVGYTVAVNSGPERTGTLTVAGQTFTVTQSAGTTSTCTFTITPTGRSHGADAATGTVAVTTQAGCAWTATSSASWLTITSGASGSGSGSVGYSVAANTAGERTGTLTIAGQTFTVTQLATGTPAPAAVVDAGRFGRSVPSGGLASLFGTSFGTTTLVAQAIPLPTTLGGVSVLLNGVALPLFFVSPTQVNFQLPWDVPAGATLTVVANGVTSAPMTLNNVAERAPAIFSLDSSGRGQGAVIIAATGEIAAPVGSIPGRVSRPARHGEFISIFASGLGPVTNPPPPGAAAGATQLSVAFVPPFIGVGGAVAPASFAGLAPGFVGLYQVNAQVPMTTAAGNAVPLTLIFPDGTSNTVTIAVE